MLGPLQVDAISERAYELAEEGRPVVKLSLIGYSLGGIMQRYVAGKLYSLRWFGPAQPKAPPPQPPRSELQPLIAAREEKQAASATCKSPAAAAAAHDVPGELRLAHRLAQPVAIVEPVQWVSVATPRGCCCTAC